VISAPQKTLIASGVALALGAPAATAALVADVFGPYDWSTDSANFTVLNPTGSTVGGTNDVNMAWDGNAYNASSDYTGPGSAVNMTASSTTAYIGKTWTAHDIQVFVPGSYSFDVSAGDDPNDGEVGSLNVTVGAGQLGMHMLWDWIGLVNVDIFMVWDQDSVFGAGIRRSSQHFSTAYGGFSNHCDNGDTANCLWDGPSFGPDGRPTGDELWMLSSADGNGDGVIGIPMVDGGAFPGYTLSFNANLNAVAIPGVPLPPAVWLFGSGLLGLLPVTRRKKMP